MDSVVAGLVLMHRPFLYNESHAIVTEFEKFYKVYDENGIVMPFTYVGKGQLTNPRKQVSFDEQKKKNVTTYLFDIPMEHELPDYLQYDFGLTK